MFYLLLLPVMYAYQNVASRFVQRVAINLYAVGAFTYLFSALLYGLGYALHPLPLPPLILGGGVVLGLLYVATYWLFVPTLADRGVSIMAALCQLSALVPMVASLLIWHEHPTAVRLTGAVLCLIAMPLLALDKGVTDTHLTGRKLVTFLGMVVLNGGVLLAFKWFDEQHAGPLFPGFMLTSFASATVAMALLWPAYHGRLTGPVLSWGGAMSLCYTGASLLLVLALKTYEGAIVFPFAEATAVALTVAFAALAWREIPGRVGLTGVALVTVAAVLVNL